MKTVKELQPQKCPFCKSLPIMHCDIVGTTSRNYYYVCPECGLRSPMIKACSYNYVRPENDEVPLSQNEQERLCRLWNWIRIKRTKE